MTELKLLLLWNKDENFRINRHLLKILGNKLKVLKYPQGQNTTEKGLESEESNIEGFNRYLKVNFVRGNFLKPIHPS